MKTSKEHSTQAAPKAVSQPAAPVQATLAQQLGNAGLLRILQAKLAVGDPQDHFEQEADRVADQVMRMPDAAAGSAPAPASTQTTAVQRAADATSALPVVDAVLEGAVAALDGRGRPLSPELRSFMEPRFGADLSAVRIHTDAHAHDLASSVNARAFTVGRNVVFGAGYYAPQTDSGRRLIAHEVTHTLQQGATSRLARSPKTSVTQPYPTIEHLGPYTYSTQQVTDGKTAHWRVWNWARTDGESKVIDRGPQRFLEQLVAQARDAGHDMLILTIENISADSVQRLSKPGSPMAKHLGATAVERIDNITIQMTIPLGGKAEGGGTDSGSGGGAAPRPLMVAGPDDLTARQPSGVPKASPTATRGSRPADVPETLSPSDGVPIAIGGPDEAVPEHIDDGPSIHRPLTQSPGTPAGSTSPRMPRTPPGSSGGSGSSGSGSTGGTGSSTPSGTTNQASGRSPADPFASTPVASTAREAPTQRRAPTPTTSSQTPDPFGSTPVASTARETPTQRRAPRPTTSSQTPDPFGSTPVASTQETLTGVQPGTPTQVHPTNLFKGEQSGAAERLAPSVERVSVDQWIHIEEIPDDDGVNKKYLITNAAGEKWLFKPATGEAGMGLGPELGIRRGERWRRALAAAYLAQDLGLNTPYVQLIEVHSPTGTSGLSDLHQRVVGMVGSLQEWRQGYEVRPKTRNQAQEDFDRFWNSRFRHDIDAFDYFIGNQDRHKRNVMIRMEGDRPSTMLIDQDSGIPASPERFSRMKPRDELKPWQRDLPPSVSSELADRFRELADSFPEAALRKWLTGKEVNGLRSRLNEVIAGLDSGSIGIIDESPTRAAEMAQPVPTTRRTSGTAASGSFSTSGSTEDFSTGGTTKNVSTSGSTENVSTNGSTKNVSTNGSTENVSTNGSTENVSTNGSTENVSTSGSTKVASTRTGRAGSPSPTPSPTPLRSPRSAAPTATRTGPAPDSGAKRPQKPTQASPTPPSGEAPLPKAAATIAPGPEPWGGRTSNAQVTAAEAIGINKDVEHQTAQGPRQTSMGASASGQAVTVDMRTGGPGRQTTGALTFTAQDVGFEVGSQTGKGGPTAGIRLDSQGNPTFDVGYAFQTQGGSSIKPTFSHGTRVEAREPIELEDGRFLVAYTMTETTTVGVGGAARRAPPAPDEVGGLGFSAGGNVSAFEAESKQGTRIFKTPQEAEAFRDTAALQLTFDRTTAVPATSDEAEKIPVGETRAQSDTEGRNVGVSGSFGGATLGRNWQTSDTTGLSFYRMSKDLLNVTATVTQDKAKDWGISGLILANQKGGDTTKAFGVTIQFNISTQAGRQALDLYLKTRFPPLGGAKIVGVMDLTGDGDYDRYQMPGTGTDGYSDRGWHKETRDEQGVTKEVGGEQVHQQDPTWLGELTGDRELYSSAQLISQQIRGKEQYTAIINIKSESGEYNRGQFGKIFGDVKTSGPVEQSGAWTLSAEIDKKVVHELESVSTKFKDAKNQDDKQRILSDVFRKSGAGMAGGLVRSGGRFTLAWDLELKGDPNFPGPAGREKLAMQREELARKLKTSPEAAAQVVREAQEVLNRLDARRKNVKDPEKYTDLPQELRKQQIALIGRHAYEFDQVRSNALMAAGKRDPKESIEAIRARIKQPHAYDHLSEMALLQDKVADQDAAINETRQKIEIAREAVRRARVQDNIPEKYKKHYMPSRMALREADALHKQQAELGSKVQELRARAFNAAASQAQTEAWRQLEAAVSLRSVLLTQEINKINDAGAELVLITTPESRLDARYDEFWAPIEDLADEEPEEEDVPAPLSMALEEPKKRKRERRR